VTVKSLRSKAQSFSARTEDDGYAKFFFPVDSSFSINSGYSIEVTMPNFKTSRVKQLHLHSPTETPHAAYVQLVMKISLHDGITVY